MSQEHLLMEIETIAREHQRYHTDGDWREVMTWYTGGFGSPSLLISVSKMQDWRYEALIAVHELIEALLCRARGISDEAVTAFDLKFEEARQAYIANLNANDGEDATAEIAIAESEEPGEAPDCPYRREHRFATQIEKLLCAEFGIEWGDYEKAVAL